MSGQDNNLSWDQYYLNMLPSVAARSKCHRRKLGAIITVDNHIIGMGYNGPPPGYPHCNPCVKEAMNIPSGEGLDVCPATHAEQNAIAFCAQHGISTRNATMYIGATPCTVCAGMIIGAGITKVVVSSVYPDKMGLKKLKECGVSLILDSTPLYKTIKR